MKRMKTVERPAVMLAHVEVLLLQEENGTYTAMCECNADMREVLGPTVEATQEAVRRQWADPPPIRFPDDFPLMPREFAALKAVGVALPPEQHFSWWVLDMDARHRALVSQLRESMASIDDDLNDDEP